MKSYRVLNKQIFTSGEYSLVPIRHEDRYNIMEWRNEQIYHLRQAEPLTKEKQDAYFENVVAKLFDQEQPDQILFSFLQNEECIGYGGLVHINWVDQNAEVSFITATEREKEYFKSDWRIYLSLLSKVSFRSLELHKVFTYAFDIRPKLYSALENSGFRKEAVLKEHCHIEGMYRDVIIHSKYNRIIKLIEASKDDLDITFKWASNPVVRRYSFDKSTITFEGHKKWFFDKLNADSCFYLIAEYNKQRIGSFRLDVDQQGIGIISYLLDPLFHGLGLGNILLKAGVDFALRQDQVKTIIGDVMKTNLPSINAFEKLGFRPTTKENGIIRFQLNVA